MCVAIHVPREATPPTLNTLLDCEIENPHGGGIAYPTFHGVQWHKGLTAKQLHRYAQEHAGKPMLIHFRIATAGTISKELCHPFPITRKVSLALNGTANSVLIHNGHWFSWDDFLPRGARKREWTDTRVMAQLAHFHGIDALRNTGQRIAILRRDGATTLLGDWRQLDGVFYSNFLWRDRFECPFEYRPGKQEPAVKPRSADEWQDYWRNWGQERLPAKAAPKAVEPAKSPAKAETRSSAFDEYVNKRYGPEYCWESITDYFAKRYPDEDPEEMAIDELAKYLWDDVEEVQQALAAEESK